MTILSHIMANKYTGEDLSYNKTGVDKDSQDSWLADMNGRIKDYPAAAKRLSKDLQLPAEHIHYELTRRLENLAVLTSLLGWALKESNLKMVERFVANNTAVAEAFSSPTLTEKAFEHDSTKEFLKGIKQALGKELKKSGGILKKNALSDYKEEIKAPQFNNPLDGLMFAVHKIHCWSVDIKDYHCDLELNSYTATLDITLFDHFGMDYNDVGKFGTVVNMLKLFKPGWHLDVLGIGGLTALGVTTASAGITAAIAAADDNEDVEEPAFWTAIGAGAATAAVAGLMMLAGQAAKGFRAWFLLQHYFGYRPFTTEMRREVSIMGTLPVPNK